MPDCVTASFMEEDAVAAAPGDGGIAQAALPELIVTLPAHAGTKLDPALLFPSSIKEIWLEIGFGGGEHLAAQAAASLMSALLAPSRL